MARISITNGRTTCDVAALTIGQIKRACEAACARDDDPAYVEIDGRVYSTERAWLAAYCNAHERHHGAIFIAW